MRSTTINIAMVCLIAMNMAQLAYLAINNHIIKQKTEDRYTASQAADDLKVIDNDLKDLYRIIALRTVDRYTKQEALKHLDEMEKRILDLENRYGSK